MTDALEMTRSLPIVARSAMSCSVTPSAKYACSGSPDRLSSGMTATDRIWPGGSLVDQRWNAPATTHTDNPVSAASRMPAAHLHAWLAFETTASGGAWV